MSSDAPDRPRKTLTLSSRPAAKPAKQGRSDAPRTRTGPRAHAVARAERAAPDTQAQVPEGGPRSGGKGYAERGHSRERPARPERPPVLSSTGSHPVASASGRPGSHTGAGPQAGKPRRDDAGRNAAGTEQRYQRGVPSRNTRASNPSAPQARNDTPGQTSMRASRHDAGSDIHAANLAAIHASTDQAERFGVFAPCPQGLEDALCAELLALGFDDATPGRAGAGFSADWAGIQRANLYSRLATRILVQVAQAPMYQDDDVLELARATPWERWFGPEHTLRVDTSAIRSPVKSLQYCNLRVKDGICDRLRDLEGERPSIDTVRPDARVHLFLFEQTATLYLDTSGESLFKRGWRLDKGEAPLRENLAAGMLALADWDPEHALMDPFCGSGTLLIEAAWIALGIPPGIARPLGFERLRGHDAHAWDIVKEEAYSRIAPGLDAPIIGYDIDPAAIEFSKRNAERAWLADDAIRFEVRDARQAERVAETGWIVTNPPYGDRLENSDPALWQDWSGTLKHQFAGWNLHVITSDMAFPQQLRLKPRRRTPIYNGGIECRLFGFELVAAGFRGE